MKCSTPISSHVHENEEIKPGGKFEILQFYNSLKKMVETLRSMRDFWE